MACKKATSTNNIIEIIAQNEEEPPSPNKNTYCFTRMFSFDTSVKSDRCSYYNGPSPRDFSRPYCGTEFLIKLLQLFIGIISMAFYSQGLQLLINNVTSYMFPYVVCGTYLIVTTVIVTGFLTNNAMPDILIRVFNILGFLLYFIAGCITSQFYYAWRAQKTMELDIYDEYYDYNFDYYLENRDATSKYEDILDQPVITKYEADSILAATVFLFLNSILYFFDVCLSFRKIFAEIDRIGEDKPIAKCLIAIICAGLFTEGLRLLQMSPAALMLPNIIFSASIIITSVILLSFVLGQIMPPFLIAIFCFCEGFLYFCSASATIYSWGKSDITDVKYTKHGPMLLGQSILSYLNAFLYFADIFITFYNEKYVYNL